MHQPITVEKIRAMYPDPVISSKGIENGRYCVGGALCLYTGIESRIPMTATLANRLRVINPALWDKTPRTLKDMGSTYAFQIITANDDGDFEKAWQLLGEALTFSKTSIITEEA